MRGDLLAPLMAVKDIAVMIMLDDSPHTIQSKTARGMPPLKVH